MTFTKDTIVGAAMACFIFPIAHAVGRLNHAEEPRLTLITVGGQMVGVALMAHRAYRIDQQNKREDNDEA